MKFYSMNEAGERERAADKDESPVDSLVMAMETVAIDLCRELDLPGQGGAMIAMRSAMITAYRDGQANSVVVPIVVGTLQNIVDHWGSWTKNEHRVELKQVIALLQAKP